MIHPRAQNVLDHAEYLLGSQPIESRKVLHEEAFRRLVAVERKRTERTNLPFLLMLIEGADRQKPGNVIRTLDGFMAVLLSATRETDVIGWYRQDQVIGLLFTGLSSECKSNSLGGILSRVSSLLREKLTFEQVSQISISFHLFPDEWNRDDSDHPSSSVLYPDLHEAERSRQVKQCVKRAIDFTASAILLILGFPLFAAIAVAVKVTSRGPVFFKQQRVGQYGCHFTFLKFRSMRDRNDASIHRQYVTQLIAGTAERIKQTGTNNRVYKLANDSRVTPLGKFLRKSSLDELPQLVNVLRGEMSLVGPRPPIPYELAAYQTWHRLRVLQVRPGITGLWQVTGRSRVSFDEMVRLDLQYASLWSLGLDFRILLRTPAAVFRGAF